MAALRTGLVDISDENSRILLVSIMVFFVTLTLGRGVAGRGRAAKTNPPAAYSVARARNRREKSSALEEAAR